MPRKKLNAEQAFIAKCLVAGCFRNAPTLENIHSGNTPHTKTGDYSDVKIIDGDGREILWNELSRISQGDMKQLMKEAVNQLYKYLMKTPDQKRKYLEFASRYIREWDDPDIP